MSDTNEVRWDLSDLYAGLDDPAISEAISEQERRADEFALKYRGTINSADLTPETLTNAIREYENILQELEKPHDFASLLFAADTSDARHGAFLQRMREEHTRIMVKLMFFELELLAASAEVMDPALASPLLDGYRHFVHAERLYRDHRLSEPEETILEEKSNTGRRAFTRLFEQTVSGIRFKVSGEEKEVTLPEVLAMQRDPDRETRRLAAESLTTGLVENSGTLTYIFNTLIQDKAVEDRLRSFAFPEHSRHISNELDRETVEVVVGATEKQYPMVGRYYELKRSLLGYETLTHYDRYAPALATKEHVPFDSAKKMVLDAFGAFSPQMRKVAEKFFDRRWIDAEIREGKRGGAFCSYVTPDIHPYVFMNYLNRSDDVMTLAHELGHAVHASLAGKKGYLSFATPLPVAELASTFGEILVFESLLKTASLEEKLALYAEKIEGVTATVFRQAAMYRFEQDIHIRRRESGELTTEDFSSLWQTRIQEMFGDSVALGDEHRFWWMYVSHFISSPFYVYAYTFGELLVLALYAMYKREGEAFAPKYIRLLETGGSKSPSEMLLEIGIDIHDPAFWLGGFEVLGGFVGQFEDICRSVNKLSGTASL